MSEDEELPVSGLS